jgi:hypothetical protein
MNSEVYDIQQLLFKIFDISTMLVITECLCILQSLVMQIGCCYVKYSSRICIMTAIEKSVCTHLSQHMCHYYTICHQSS